MNTLLNALGEVQAERFTTLIIREPSDYTTWQRTLWQDRSVQKMGQAAMEYRKSQHSMDSIVNCSLSGTRGVCSAVPGGKLIDLCLSTDFNIIPPDTFVSHDNVTCNHQLGFIGEFLDNL